MRGIISWGSYLPHRRLDRSTIAPFAGTGGGKGTRTVASYDEDATTMGVEAARRALRSPAAVTPATLWFSTVAPTYLDKTNATTLHAALRLDRPTPVYDALGSARSALGALRAALTTAAPLWSSADLRGGLPGGTDEAAGGDGAAALLVGDGPPARRRRVRCVGIDLGGVPRPVAHPRRARSKLWEERFGESALRPARDRGRGRRR